VLHSGIAMVSVISCFSEKKKRVASRHKPAAMGNAQGVADREDEGFSVGRNAITVVVLGLYALAAAGPGEPGSSLDVAPVQEQATSVASHLWP
jgi:hypothetical protein